MKYPAYRYVDTAIGGVNNRNNVVDITSFKVPVGEADCYRTVFRFDENYKQIAEQTNSVKGYKGKCYADWIPLDIDSENLEDAYKKTLQAIGMLAVDFDVEVYHLFFSGAKGFHILLHSNLFDGMEPLENLPQIFKGVVKDLVGDIADSIYDINRLFRLNNTVNSKTGLFKVPLTRADFNKGVAFICEYAKGAQHPELVPFSDLVVNRQLVELYEKHRDAKQERVQVSGLMDKISNGAANGERNTSATRIAGLLRGKDVPAELAAELLAGWNRGNESPLESEELKAVIESVYQYPNNTSDLAKNIFPIWAVHDEYKEFVKSSKGVNLGIPEIDEKIRQVRPGQVLTILGFTGNFKTAILQDIMRHYHAYSSEPVLLFEMEMSRLDLFERAVQQEHGIDGQLVEAIFRDEDKQNAEDLVKRMEVAQRNFFVVDVPGLSFSLMAKYVTVAEESVCKRKLGLVGIDFLQLASGSGNTTAQRVDAVAKAMKEFAKKMDVPVIAVSQVTDVDDEQAHIKLMDSRDSKTIAHMSDYVIGIWQEDKQQAIALLKNRKGGLCTTHRTIDNKTLRFSA